QHLPSWSRDPEKSERFPHAIADFFASNGITERELRMLDFVNQITDKPDWHKKVFDGEIVQKWKEEGVRFDEALHDFYLSEKMFEVCLEELCEKAAIFEKTQMVHVLDSELTVVKSDSMVPPELQQKLLSAVRPLEDVPESQKDWHPGSNNQVLDLVHPSLFPLVYGLSKVLPMGKVPLDDCAKYTGRGETIPVDHSPREWAKKTSPEAWGEFQWLPANVEFIGNDTKITSYINGLHPQKHKELYAVLEQLVEKAVPLWSDTLSWFHSRTRIKIEGTGADDYEIPEGVIYDGPDNMIGVEESDDEWDERLELLEDSDDYRDWKEDHQVLIEREPHDYVPFVKTVPENQGHIDLRTRFAESGLQVIFKLANIHLTPEKPKYEGGTWHVEGALNEHICATALYYYDQDNITDSHLSFRQEYDIEGLVMIPEQHNFRSCEEYFGISNEEHAVKELGSVLTRTGRLLTFPNVLQHKLSGFELADPTKPGHRKILAMFLVDPRIPVISTANVPPQDRRWWAEEVRHAPGQRLSRLPKELFDEITKGVDGFPISWDQAVDIRARLMDERGAIQESVSEAMESQHFSFCEH
ncbi:hypothetical protein PG985_000370, partial [Apiospora marii]|uniref:uncharacterized protein n=1 Tax=Apiospora marii TaxID=335849 RepID=UPI00313112EE